MIEDERFLMSLCPHSAPRRCAGKCESTPVEYDITMAFVDFDGSIRCRHSSRVRFHRVSQQHHRCV